MQIKLEHGGKTAEYECQFKDTEVIYYPDGTVRYKLGEVDITTNFRCIGNLAYQEKYGDVNNNLLDYYIYFIDNKAYLDIQNQKDLSFVNFHLCLTKSEMDKIKSMTLH